MAENMPLVARIMVQHGGEGPPGGPGVTSGGGNGGGGGGGGGDKETQKNTKGIKNLMGKQLTQGRNHLAKTIGINIGTASILKQSQVFTGYIGTIFQLMGALVDVILAPFLPIVIPAIKLLASFIPIAREVMKDIFAILGWVWKGVVKGFKFIGKYLGFLKKIPPEVTMGFKKALVTVLIGLFFMKLFNLSKITNALTKGTAMASLTVLRIIAANTAMAGKGIVGGNVASRAHRGKMLKMGARGLGRFAGIAFLLTAMGGILMRGFGSIRDSSQRSQSSDMTGVTRLEEVMRASSNKSSNRLEVALSTGVGVIHGGLALGQIATRLVGTKIGNMWNGLKNLGRRQGRDALGRFTKMRSVWGRMADRATAVGKAIGSKVSLVRTGLNLARGAIVRGGVAGFAIVKDGLIAAKTAIAAKFPILGKAVTAVKTGLGEAKAFIGEKVTSMKKVIGDRLTTVKKAVTDRLTSIKAGINSRLTIVKKAVTDKIALGKQWATDAAEAIKGRLNTVKTAITGRLTIVKTAITTSLTTLGTSIKGFFGGMGNLLKKIPGVSKAIDLAKNVGKAIQDKVGGGIKRLGGLLFGKAAGKDAAGKATAKTAGLFSRMGTAVAKATAPLSRFAKGALLGVRAVPVIGAIAEAAYGSYKTYKSFKEYGAKAGFARLGATMAATTGALFDPTGLASAGASIAMHETLSFLERKGSFGDKRNGNGFGPGTGMTVKLVVETGVGSTLEQHQITAQTYANNEITVRARDPWGN